MRQWIDDSGRKWWGAKGLLVKNLVSAYYEDWTKVTKRSAPSYRQMPKDRRGDSIESAPVRLFKSICFWTCYSICQIP